MSFKLLKTSKKSKARLGILTTPHGKIETPFFLPIATAGAVKALDAEDLKKLKAQVLLGNTYHLYLQPGEKVIKKAKGLHQFMNWKKPILTDSGGYQVFSLARIRKITKQGVEFHSHIDGKKHTITPEKSIKIQQTLGSDIAMSFDVCPPYPSTVEAIEHAMKLTTEWARIGKGQWSAANHSKRQLFGIIQGGVSKALRIQHTKEIVALGFDGYALGGLAVGEPVKKMYETIDWCEPYMPANKPRYLMGAGYPEQLIEVVKRGIDMFDCVIPTREARHGRLYLWRPQARNPKHEIRNKSKNLKHRNVTNKNFYKVINITNAKFKTDFSPINDTNLKLYSKAYLHHLFKAKEPLALRFATLNNLDFYLTLIKNIRYAIQSDKL